MVGRGGEVILLEVKGYVLAALLSLPQLLVSCMNSLYDIHHPCFLPTSLCMCHYGVLP